MSRGVGVGVLGVLGVVVAACGSGQSILQAGNEPLPTVATTTTVAGPPVTAAPGETLAPTVPPTVATTTTTPLDTLAPCPVDALDDASGPVEITFWHGLGAQLETVLTDLTQQYNRSQDRVRVRLENQGGYNQTIDKYVQSRQESRPELVMFPEYMVQQIADTESVIPVGACVQASGFDTSAFLPRTLLAYQTNGVQWSMPFNVSVPVLYFNRKAFVAAGVDVDDPPLSIEDVRSYSQAIVDSGAAGVGMAFDSGVDSGGGWFIEQWFAKAGELYADNGNGRLAPATRVLYDGAVGVELMTRVQSMITDGIAVTVGDNASGQDALLKLADQQSPAAMTIATSAALGTIISALDGGLIPGLTSADVGVGPMPGPGGTPSALVGGASLYVVADKGDAEAAAAWDYIQFLVGAETQATWAAGTGYVPVRQDALELEPLASTYRDDPRFKVAYDQLTAAADDLAAVGPVIGPLREVRGVTAGAVAAIFDGADVASSLAGAAAQSNALIADYNARN
ncbi:MAG: extracellular solute-binding protein [Acidimicrobiia bacterium]|nr:extracellular solute-binding protein [Acidimicrobiia bacterium]